MILTLYVSHPKYLYISYTCTDTAKEIVGSATDTGTLAVEAWVLGRYMALEDGVRRGDVGVQTLGLWTCMCGDEKKSEEARAAAGWSSLACQAANRTFSGQRGATAGL